MDANGYGGLNKIWKTWDERLAPVLPRRIGLIYDCDIENRDDERGLVKRRTISRKTENPVTVGIENLFPESTIRRLLKSDPIFFDVKPSREIRVRGKIVAEPEVIEVNTEEKANLRKHLVEVGNVDDFRAFESVLDLIRDVSRSFD